MDGPEHAVSVATGGTALGSIDVEQGDVLYLALEDNERRLQDRLQILLQGNPLPPRLHLATQWTKIGDGCMQAIDAWIQQATAPRLIVIDTLKKVKKGRGAKDMYDHDYDVGACIHTTAHIHGVAMLAVHHLKKESTDDPMDQISGSLGLTGSVDGSLMLERKRGEDSAILHIMGAMEMRRENRGLVSGCWTIQTINICAFWTI